jgi:hypothetical protein
MLIIDQLFRAFNQILKKTHNGTLYQQQMKKCLQFCFMKSFYQEQRKMFAFSPFIEYPNYLFKNIEAK